MNKIRQGDEVIVLVGRDRGKRGSVRQILSGDRLYVSGVNMVKRHTKPNPRDNQPGGIVEREAPIHRSNVALFNPQTQKGDKVGIKVLEDGSKVRVFRSDGTEVD